MAVPVRYVLVVLILLAVFVVTAVIHNNSSPTSPRVFSYTSSADFTSAPHATEVTSSDAPKRANATFFILCQNSDIDRVIQSVRGIEDRFNREYRYPYVFLNEEPFSEEFKRRLSVLSLAKMEFGTIPHDDWFTPLWINEEKTEASMSKMAEAEIVHGGSLSYRNMCRFNSGFFFRHPLLQKYRYYWRVEPDVMFHCNIRFDPFLFMHEHNKTYGFTISLYEFSATIPSLWETVKEFSKAHPEAVHPDNALSFVSDDHGATYNLCHFWSNFEIADMDFWRSETYLSYFDFLDQAGGFYYERWGDAPVHSIAASLFLPRSSLHFFDEIGYEHTAFTHCPVNLQRWFDGQCSCNPGSSFDYDGYSCLWRWNALY